MKPDDIPGGGRVEVVGDVEMEVGISVQQQEKLLRELRKPFPEDRIEKLPKPKWKGAWTDKRGANCPECHGYHVLENTIHLDYVGHANVTDRLLEIDPYWYWEPMAYTDQGTPLFSDGGLWIKLTVVGVTRIGFGDGASVKEVIGDAIRNAAMRFGVGLDLWAKIDLQSERNPGDGEAQRGRQVSQRPVRDGDTQSKRQRGRVSGQGRQPEAREVPAQANPPRAANQDALDYLGAVCDENGLSRRAVAERFESDYDQDVRQADAELICGFADLLAEECNPDPPTGGAGEEPAGGGDVGDGDGRADGADAAPSDDESAGDSSAAADVPAEVNPDGTCVWCGEAHEGGPENCSDVAQKPGDMF
ncbi:hypothetical protein SEA_JOIEB_68 [Mycobacterium phage JoieB]|uniref:Uncharacterized protein n=3 Tax=Marvinvirus marvin TaxID=1982092 RepID=A0A385UGP6_9CAUD|nr:hypothetical protein SEA_VASUNZINGA_66 [Mycobacterium phage VasuNzinga]QFP94205.1 hypothetical protein SEA_JOIEB_68 [Mycobacterium phage JoieB]QFP96928.1 hypothetical protein SEA_PRINGAR_66 [Mycobacterium phage Pringar]